MDQTVNVARWIVRLFARVFRNTEEFRQIVDQNVWWTLNVHLIWPVWTRNALIHARILVEWEHFALPRIIILFVPVLLDLLEIHSSSARLVRIIIYLFWIIFNKKIEEFNIKYPFDSSRYSIDWTATILQSIAMWPEFSLSNYIRKSSMFLLTRLHRCSSRM